MGADTSRRWPRLDRWTLAAWAFVVVPIVAATARAVRRGWWPVSDNALIAIRSGDVFTSHHPWLGTWSSASVSAGQELNHPGPLLFDSLWPTVTLFGSRAGTAIGVALVNILAVTTIAVFSYRRGGRSTALAALAASAAVVYTMGSELLFDPWNPHILILACLATLVTAWGIALGDRWAWPVYVALGSYSLQTHLGYAYFVPGILVVALCAGWLVARSCPDGRQWLPSRRTLALSAVTGVVLWLQPLWEQLTGAGEGNLTRVLGAGGSGPRIGASLATQLMSDVVTGAVFAPRRTFIDAVPGLEVLESGALKPLGAPSLPLAIVIMIILVGGIVLLARAATQRGDRVSVAALALAGGALLVALASLAVMPIGPLGLAAHQMRWLWPITWFTWMAIACAALRWFSARERAGTLSWSSSRVATIGALAGIAVLGGWSVPTFQQPVGVAAGPQHIRLVEALCAQLGGLVGRGPVYVDATGERFVDPVSEAVMAELQRRDVDFTVGPDWLVRQLGDGRRSTGDELTTVQFRFDGDAVVVPEGARLEALVTALSEVERDELQELVDVQSSGERLSDEQLQRLDGLLAAAAGSVAVISSPGNWST